jgi:CBS domain-containing protein
MQIADVMRREFITVAPEDTLGEVARKMVDKSMGAVIVKDFGRLIGILTERDMLRAMAARVHTSDARVRQFMTEDPVTVAPDLDLDEAAQIMLDNGFRHLPVVDGTTILGVVSLRRVLGGRRHPAGEHGAAAESETAPAPEAA